MKKTIVKSVLGAGFALAAGVVFATPDVSQTFDTAAGTTVDTIATGANEGWSGDGTVVDDGRVANIPTMGSAISADASTKCLAVAGTVSCTNKANVASATPYQADFLVNIAEACDELTTDGLTGAQIAVAAGTNIVTENSVDKVKICVCYGSTPTWVETDALVPTGSWARVSLYFDYTLGTAGKCRVAVNGQPAKYNGSEYYDLIASSTHVKQLDFVGVAKIDDVFIASGAEKTTVPVAGSDMAVNVATLAKYGVSTNTFAANGTVEGSGMTISQKYEAGLALNDATKFEPIAMALPNATTATITVPYADNNGQSYKVSVSDGTHSIDVDASNENGVLTFTIPTEDAEKNPLGKVLKFSVKASL